MSRHRAEASPTLTPRYGRIAVLAVSLATTGIAVLGGIGVLPSSADGGSGAARSDASLSAQRSADPVADGGDDASSPDSETPGSTPPVSSTDDAGKGDDAAAPPAEDLSIPADSGSGRRAIFSQSQQRVWIVKDVGGKETTLRTYPVSGSVTDNLEPGTYEVYSRSSDAVGVDDSGTMKYFVRFTQGPTGAAIGFHDIPIKDGEHTQTVAQLGTPQSHGCIRAQRPDAKAMWAFAQLGTTVVVTA